MSLPYRQDMPPAGGFDSIKYKRNLPFRGPGAFVILGTVAAISGFGFWRLGLGNLEKRELQREKVWSRIHIVPLLLAEGDRDAYRRQQAATEREREIMKDVPGWEAGKSVYNSKKYYTPETIAVV
ncbi:GRIM-19 [Pterulicium gracile]|uniref:NADH dehydrogenase [ubiquinone] 1 alpha subcomplex subunit 13 n=1 Tax=Pterulicium gracile TaxID=1884261 RepID=A0A5C3QB17_9AGAR|nr:GRIM-19 [Pterula gracilis]